MIQAASSSSARAVIATLACTLVPWVGTLSIVRLPPRLVSRSRMPWMPQHPAGNIEMRSCVGQISTGHRPPAGVELEAGTAQ